MYTLYISNMKEILVVMGNGPSLKELDWSLLEGCDTFGLNGAYRIYEKINWYPTYHGCFDQIVTDSHQENFAKLINTGKIKQHFYINNISDKSNFTHVNMQLYGTTKHVNKSTEDFKFFTDNGNSGANACSVGMCLGYKKILLVGVDCNYVNFVQGAAPWKTGLQIMKTPDKNPNYWFDDYQQKGDRYNIPRGDKFMKPTWCAFGQLAKEHGIRMINCSSVSKLDCFDKLTLKEAIAECTTT